MKIKLISDGTPKGTRVLNAETGEPIQGVRRAAWAVEIDQPAVVTLDFVLAEVDLTGDAAIVETTAIGDEVRSYRRIDNILSGT